MDYSQYPINNKIYTGAEKKIGITIENEDYILKFQKKTTHGYRYNHVSEYIACRIIQSMGFNVQETYLGTYNKQEIVVIKDFVQNNQQFVTFNDLGESSIEADRERFTYSYDDITKILKSNNKLKYASETVDQFWDLYILDALLGNFDRHGGNWGFIKENNQYTLAPIFDNGSCLYPSMIDDEKMIEIMNDLDETKLRVFTFPTSQILLNGNKSSYYEVINSLSFEECNQSLIKIYHLYSQDKIDQIIEETDFISTTHKKFYKYIIQKRFELILRDSFMRLKNHE